MIKRTFLVAGAATVVSCCGMAAAVAEDATTVPFGMAHVRFEQNATDGDVEVIFEVAGRNDGLTKLKIAAPDGRVVVDFSAAGGTGTGQKPGSLGMRQFTFESPEPTDVDGLKASYPAGLYAFTGATAKGAALQSEAKLDHTLPATTSFVFPKRGAEEVPTKNLQIQWEPVEGVEGYVLELEHERSGSSLVVKLPGSANSFAVPEGFLLPEQEYQLGVGTVSTAGNISYVEIDFTTAASR